VTTPQLTLTAGERTTLLAQLDRQTLRLPRGAGWAGLGCSLWEGSQRDGYGVITVGGRTWLVHRLTWVLTRGPIPPDHHVHHRCGITLCRRPEHLELLSRAAHSRLHHAWRRHGALAGTKAAQHFDDLARLARRRGRPAFDDDDVPVPATADTRVAARGAA